MILTIDMDNFLESLKLLVIWTTEIHQYMYFGAIQILGKKGENSHI